MEKNNMTVKSTHISFIAFMAGYIFLVYMMGFVMPQSVPYWIEMCLNNIAICLPIALIIVIRKLKLSSFIMFESIKIKDIVLTYVSAYCLLPLVYLINFISSFFVTNYVTGMVSDISVYPLWAQLLLLAVMPAVCEEFIFRGFFYGQYRKKNFVKAVLMSGLFFGIAHLNINQFAYAFAIGVAFCLLYEATGNIIFPMIAHFAINANTVFQMQMLNSIDEQMLQEAVEVSENVSMTVGENIIVIAVMAGLSVLSTSIFGAIVMGMAKRHGRTLSFAMSKKVETDEARFIDIFWVLAVVPVFIFMVLLEIL